MKRGKKFDAVQMKWEVQRKIAEEFANVPASEARRIQMERIRKNPILGEIVRKARKGTAAGK